MNPSKLILAGGSGFLGQALAKHFDALDWEVVVLTRHAKGGNALAREVIWDGETLGDWAQELEGAAAVINLAGRSVNCRYTNANRQIIMDSRVKPTQVLGQVIACCKMPPRVWLNASSATLYRHTFGPAWDETGTDFTPAPEARDAFSVDVVRAWETAFNTALSPQTRRIALRTTMVLGHGSNSVLPMLCRLARFGLGGRMGSGKQYVSWLHETDFCRAVEWLIAHEEISGPVNLAAPNPVTNAEMMRLFRELMHAPFGLPAMEWMLEIGAFFLRTETELILKSRRVIPGKLLAGGLEFRFPTMREALRNLVPNSTSTQT
jgi:uncharacterized protein (TIGR01777 family)